jgi:hypothetical protein
VHVVECGDERRLVVDGSILSIYPRGGDWRPVRREYWWHAVAGVALPRRPTALLVGLGGGTQVHLVRALARPRLITVVERDPVIVRVACQWFGLDAVGRLEFLCADAALAVRALTAAGRRFDFVMDDVGYAQPIEDALPLARALVPLVSARGTLVVNRHRRREARIIADALAGDFAKVRLRRVRREAENVLVYGTRPLRPRSRRDSA